MAKKVPKLSAKEIWMRRFFALAGSIAPEATGHILVKLVFTPKRKILRPAHRECLAQANKFIFEAKQFQHPEKTVKVKCYSWGKGDKTILLVHGWDASAVDFYKMIPALTAAGYRVVAFDGPAHGGSEGGRTHLIDFKQVLHQMVSEWGMPYAIIGHSMGGGASTFMLMDYPGVRVQKLVAIATTIVSKRFFENLFANEKVPLKMQQAFFKGYTQELGEPVERYDLLTRKDPIKANKILMIYSDNDEVVPARDVKEFLKQNPQISSLNAKDCGHYNILKNKAVIEKITAFLSE
jgi:pimeloyl-ACP methyl ester carboxylesterase